MKSYFWIPAVFLVLLATAYAADQRSVVVRQAPMHDNASNASKKLALIKAGSLVTVHARDGGWKKVSSEELGVTGWIRGYYVRDAASIPTIKVNGESDSRGFLSGLASFSRKASSFFKSDSGSNRSGTATIGVRGLSEDEIKTARADFAEFEKMKLFSSGTKRAANFARHGGLRSIKVPYISGSKQ